MTRKRALTPDQVRAHFRRQGVTVTQWSKERGYDRDAVYRVIGGRDKATYGRAHEIAVALGMKVPDDEPSTDAGDRNTQQSRAA